MINLKSVPAVDLPSFPRVKRKIKKTPSSSLERGEGRRAMAVGWQGHAGGGLISDMEAGSEGDIRYRLPPSARRLNASEFHLPHGRGPTR
jgi:hypothetical protein